MPICGVRVGATLNGGSAARTVTMNRRLIDDIVSQLIGGRCALFVGQDLSESAQGFRGLPTSWQLSEELAAEINYRGRYRPLPQISQIFEKELGRDALVDFLLTHLGKDDYRPLPVHELIARLPFSVIVHAGWDTLLETALNIHQIPISVIRTSTDLAYDEDNLVVYKLFGSIDQPYLGNGGGDSLVITEKDQLNFFYNRKYVIDSLKQILVKHALLLIGYAPSQDSVFVRIYHDFHLEFAQDQRLAVAVQSLARPEDANAWEARDIESVVEDPVEFLLEISEALAQAQKNEWEQPDLATLSTAPRLTIKELDEHAALLDTTMDQIGVADLVEQTNVPLLSEEQLREIEAMRTSYERLMESFTLEQSAARIWLRQGNLEYVRTNYERASEYYQRALKADPNLSEAYHNLHYVRLAQMDWDGALEAYKKATAAPKALSILPDRYQIDKVLGGGGAGIVYRAWDSKIDQPVAIKVLHPAQVQTEKLFKNFEREATILRLLKHPNIVQILDYQAYMGVYYIVMEYLDGKTVKEALETTSQGFSLDQSYQYADQVSEALNYAHGRNVVHRDIKPSNLFLVDGQIKLVDFGLARQVTGEQLTMLENAGTAAYMSPEQMKGDKVDARTDEYALATVFYEMLAGFIPQGTSHPLSDVVGGLNSALDLVIERAREYDPDKRYPTVKDFQSELRRVVSLQAAASNAPWWIKGIARIAQAAKVAITRGWYAWLAAGIVLGFLIPALIPAPLPREVARYTAGGMLITLLITWVARPFTAFIARRTHYASVAAYGPLMGVILGVANSLLWLPSFSYTYVFPEPRLGYAGPIEMVMLILSSGFLSLGSGIFVFPVLSAVSWAAGRRQRSSFTLIIITFVVLIILIFLAAYILPFGWFGDLSVAPNSP